MPLVKFWRLVVSLGGLFLSMNACAGGIEYVKVLDVTGSAEVYSVSNPQWLPLRKETMLKEGSRVRTGTGGEVQIVLDPNFESIAKIGGNSRLRLLKDQPFEAVLEQGAFFIFSDKGEGDSERFLKVLTKETLIQLKTGGCQIISLKKGVLVKVFADSVELSKKMPQRTDRKSQEIREGFKSYLSVTDPAPSSRRMNYRDYADWQIWIQKIYEIKDDAMDDLWEKEMAA